MKVAKGYSGYTRVCALPKDVQDSIRALLESMGMSQEDVEVGMNSRLYDLADTIQES